MTITDSVPQSVLNPIRKVDPVLNTFTVVFVSQRESLEKESLEFCEYRPFACELIAGSCNSHLKIMRWRVLLFKNGFLQRPQVDLCLRMLFIILAVPRLVKKVFLTIIVLATRGVIVVKQAESYGDISLKIAI